LILGSIVYFPAAITRFGKKIIEEKITRITKTKDKEKITLLSNCDFSIGYLLTVDCLKIYWYFFPYLTILHAPVAPFDFNQTGRESRHNEE